MICQCTISSAEANKSHGFDARDIGAPWCEQEAVTTVRLSFADRTVNVWVCQAHYDEYVRSVDL